MRTNMMSATRHLNEEMLELRDFVLDKVSQYIYIFFLYKKISNLQLEFQYNFFFLRGAYFDLEVLMKPKHAVLRNCANAYGTRVINHLLRFDSR